PAGKLLGVARSCAGLEYRSAGARGLPYHSLSAFLLAHADDARCKADLIGETGSQWPRGKNVPIPDAIAAIDHNERVVHVQLRALKSVVHDQEVTSSLDEQCCTGCTLRRDGSHRMFGQKQGFVTDLPRAVFEQI